MGTNNAEGGQGGGGSRPGNDWGLAVDGVAAAVALLALSRPNSPMGVVHAWRG